jgi:hypothetical protein
MSLIEQEFFNLIVQLKLTLPRVVGVPSKKQPYGSLVYNTLDDNIYFSNGTSWILLSSSGIKSIIAGVGVDITGTPLDVVINTKSLISSDTSIISNIIGTDNNVIVNDISTYDKYYNAFPKNTAAKFGTVFDGSPASWTGGVYAPSTGKIYGIPRVKDHVVVIDPGAKTTAVLGAFNPVVDKWLGGVLAPNGKIYCPPIRETTVLIIDPVANTVDTTSITGLDVGLKWHNGCLAPNGKIYTNPAIVNNKILIIDPLTDTATTFISAPVGVWAEPVLSPNGKIYCIPRAYDADDVLVIDHLTNTSSLMGISPIINHALTSVMHPDGKIYSIPYDATDVLVIDTIANTSFYMGANLPGTSKWMSGVLTPSGDIYGVPASSPDLLIIHTGDGTVETVPNIFGAVSNQTDKFFGGTLAPDGCIYTIPWASNQVGYITTGPPSDFTSGIHHPGVKMQVPWEYCISNYFNKY